MDNRTGYVTQHNQKFNEENMNFIQPHDRIRTRSLPRGKGDFEARMDRDLIGQTSKVLGVQKSSDDHTQRQDTYIDGEQNTLLK